MLSAKAKTDPQPGSSGRRWRLLAVAAGAAFVLLTFVLLSGVATLGAVFLWKSGQPNPIAADGRGDIQPGPNRRADVTHDRDAPGKDAALPGAALDAKTRAYQQFAELASMFDSVGVGRATMNYQSMYLERSAPWRAKKLLALNLTDPVLKKATSRFVAIAILYYTSVQYLDKTNWTPEEMGESIERLKTTLEKDKDNDFPINTLVDQLIKKKHSKNNNSVIGGTLARLALQDASVQLELQARLWHSRMWAEVLAGMKPDGGTENKGSSGNRAFCS